MADFWLSVLFFGILIAAIMGAIGSASNWINGDAVAGYVLGVCLGVALATAPYVYGG